MSIESTHADHGATFATRGDRTVVSHYGRPERAHRAVRNGVGLIERVVGVVSVRGDDRIDYVDNVLSNRVPSSEGEGCYALLLDPQGGIETDLYVYNAGERVLCFTPPGRAEALADEWAEKVFIQDVEIDDVTDDLAIFGVHGPQATEKVASVLHGSATPDEPLTFVRGSIADAGVSVIRTDAPTGEEGYEIICDVTDAPAVFEALSVQGMNAAPFGYQTWGSLTLEAGTPLFEHELAGTIPNVLGLRNALDFAKGCYVGQEVVSRVENRGQPSRRLIGLTLGTDGDTGEADDTTAVSDSTETAETGDGTAESADAADQTAEPGAAVFDGDSVVGEVTRSMTSPTLETPIALALVDFDLDASSLTVRVDGEALPATATELPFVDGSERSARLPSYP
ncbi:folate-binding protein YgfZ [Halovivax asiaticus JCM 14624]|uniref:Folate-binding protein YgfZ n=2 Tax=Halovivax asiaticus TaxID=332953 RepID=M0BF64_9EURY|nr:folate-binding protein YgfZ [Halovivax asiaticus JCM 14624]